MTSSPMKPGPAVRRHPHPAPPAKPKQRRPAKPKQHVEGGPLPVLMSLPLEDLKKPGCGAWDGSINWKKSSLAEFGGQPAVKVFYQKGSGTSGMAHPEASGISFSCENRHVKGASGLIVSFEVYFDPARWDWSRGGKVGGIFVGPGVASGYRHSENGASHRMMWQRDGGAISYIYPPANLPQQDPKLKDEGHGVGFFADTFPAGTLKKGQWNSVAIGVKLNTFDGKAPNPDGMSLLRINGATGILRNIRWARSPDIRIDSFLYGTFFGGPEPALVDSVSYVRNFKLHPFQV